MPKKQSTKKRTQVEDLPKKDKKLSAGEMKKIKGGLVEMSGDNTVVSLGKLGVKPGAVK